MNKVETAKIAAILSATFPDRAFTREQIEVWHIMLEDMPYPLAEEALKAVLSKNRFFLTIAEIREEAAAIARPIPLAAEAWEEVKKAIEKIGSWGTPVFSDPLIKKTVDSFGWLDMCRSENIDVVRGQFIKLYESVARREKEFILFPASVNRLIAANRSALQDKQLRLNGNGG